MARPIDPDSISGRMYAAVDGAEIGHELVIPAAREKTRDARINVLRGVMNRWNARNKSTAPRAVSIAPVSRTTIFSASLTPAEAKAVRRVLGGFGEFNEVTGEADGWAVHATIVAKTRGQK